jgi:hypothetical protein
MKDLINNKKVEWERQQVHFLLVSVVSPPYSLTMERALEMKSLLHQCLPKSRVASLVFRRGGSGELVERCTAALGVGIEVRPAEYASAQESWMLHREPATGPVMHVSRPPGIKLPAGVTVPALVKDNAIVSSLPAQFLVRSVVEKRIFDVEPLKEADLQILSRMTEHRAGTTRLMHRATVLALHGFVDDWPQATLVDQLLPCAGMVNPATGGPLPAGASFAAACGSTRWCNQCEQIMSAADRTVHPMLLIDAIATVVVDGLLGGRREGADSQRHPMQSMAETRDGP